MRREIEFERLVDKEVRAASESRRPLANIYALTGTEATDWKTSVEAEFQTRINRETADTDSHPSPIERFRLARKVVSKFEPVASGFVWDLFTEREKLTQEMSSMVEARLLEVAT